MKFTRSILATLAAVAALGLFGCGSSSSPTSVSPSLDSTPPSAPEGLALSPTVEYNTLSWTASSDAGVVKYEVYQYQPDPSRDNAYVMIGESTTASFQLIPVNTDSDTYFRVCAVDQAGNRSALSSELDAHVPAISSPGRGSGGDTPPKRMPE